MTKLSRFLAAALALSFIGTGPAIGAPDYSVEVVLSTFLNKRLASIDAIERDREEQFRRLTFDSPSNRSETDLRFNNSRFSKVKWANETLVPDVENYGVETLLRAMVEENLRRAAPAGFNDRIRVTIKRLQVSNHSLAVLQGGNNFARGTIERIDAATGQVKEAYEVTANLVVDPTVDSTYQGDDFAFAQTDEDTRVGPTLAYLVEKSMKRMFPEAAIASTRIITFDDAGRRFISGR